MSKQNNQYTIPPNFIEGSTLFGGAFKIRNAIEAGILAAVVAWPVLSLNILITARIIILCITALPLAILALVGVSGESLFTFVLSFLKFLKNRRVVSKTGSQKKRSAYKKGVESPYLNLVAEYLPISKIENGIIYTKDHRYIKIIEVLPVNFLLRSAREQESIIYAFISYLKISPVKLQFKVLTKQADLNRHTDIVRQEMQNENDPDCRLLQEDYLNLISRIGSREATTRRFFIAFEYESFGRRTNEESDAIASLQIAARSAVSYLKQCGNEVLAPENEDEFTVDVLYNILCRRSCVDMPLAQRVPQIVSQYVAAGKNTDTIPSAEFFAPDTLDFTHGDHICVDGLYHSYLLIPSSGYRSQVPGGWMTLLVNAGDGIDIDLFLYKQPKERMVHKLGQQLRINRSKIRETSDTNSDFSDLEGQIQSGYFLKDGLANNEDFYYMNILITITAETPEDLEWREREMDEVLRLPISKALIIIRGRKLLMVDKCDYLQITAAYLISPATELWAMCVFRVSTSIFPYYMAPTIPLWNGASVICWVHHFL